MIKILLQKYLKSAKGIDYSIDNNISSSYLIRLLIKKGIMLFRGVVRVRCFIFIGKGVQLDAKYLLSVSSNSSIGDYCQLDALSTHGITIGKGVSLGRFGKIRATATLNSLGHGVIVGDYVGIGDGFYLGGFGGISIGADTIIGERLTVHSDNHLFDDCSQPIRTQGVVKKKVNIGRNCWFGSNVTILGGVDIGEGCIVGAGAVVTKSIPSFSIAAGNPAKIIRERK